MDPTTATEQHIRDRIEQFMGKDWMEARKTMFTVDLFDSFLENIQRAPHISRSIGVSGDNRG